MMRLTLRTLLAYMDGILERKDAQQIGERIQQSDFASGLVQRIQDVTQRLRLTGPDASERGAGMDPNTIAEYLDNALPASRVPDFEKVCLESDSHLAEVASCHQILTLVLGEPAEVNPESRLRMYHLPKEAAEPAAASAVEGPAAGDGHTEPEDGKAAAPRHVAKIPEYLRETPRGRRRVWAAAAVVLTAALGVAALFATGQFKPGTRLGDLWPRRVASLDPTLPTAATSDVVTAPATTAKETTEEQAAIIPGAAVPPAAAPAVASAEPEIRQPVHPVAAQPVSPGPPAPLPPDPANSVASTPAAPIPPVVEPAVSSAAEPQAKPTEDSQPAAIAPEEPEPMPDHPGAEASHEGPAVAAKPASEPLAVPREPVGEYISTTEVLVRLEPQSHWHRVPAQAVLKAGDEILSFPTFRPSFHLNGGTSVQLFDGTQIVLIGSNAEGLPALDVHYGRLIVKPVQAKEARLRLQFGPHTGLVQFADAESVAMIEVGRAQVSGADPQTQPSPMVVDFYVTSGAVSWQPDAGEPISLTAPMKLRLDQNPAEPVAAQELPGWSSPDVVSLLDQRASATVEPSLATDRRIELALRELTGHRQKEVRWLAMRCLGHLGDFDPMVKGLDDPEHKLVWQDYIDQLRTALARGPQSAGQVRAGMERLFGSNGTTLYQLLWKYRKPELTKEDSAQLVTLLEHNVLAVRVLSFWNLREATGLSLYYRPEYPAAKRMPSVQKWRERMQVSSVLPFNTGAVPIGGVEEMDGSSPASVEEDQD